MHFTLSFLLAVSARDENALGEAAAKLAPVAFFAMIFYFLLRKKIAALQTKIAAPAVDHPQGGPHDHSSLARLYFRIVGFLSAQILGRSMHYHPCHRAFLASGSVCQQCGKTLLNRTWLPLAICLDATGNRISLLEANARGVEFECPECHFRWPIRETPTP